MATVATLRARESATLAYALFIEGIPYVWVTDHPNEALLGSGNATWIGEYEETSVWEVQGERTVLPGLKVGQLERGRLNFKTGQLESTAAEFTIHDFDGVLPGLFAVEGKTKVPLGERVPPGVTDLDATLIVVDATTPIDPADHYIGIERIGPGRERRFFYPFPWQGIGLHHQHHANAQQDELEPSDNGPPVVPVSTEPIIWEGRQVALYRLYRDTDSTSADWQSWPLWDDQHDGGGLVWWGVVRDAGEVDASGTWKISCYGPESLLRRKLGTFDHGWMNVADATVALSTEERGIAVCYRWYSWGSAAAGGADGEGAGDLGFTGVHTYNTAGFGEAITAPGLLPATGTKDDYVTAIAGALSDVGDGTEVGSFGGNVGPDGIDYLFDEDFEEGIVAVANLQCRAAMDADANITISRRDQSDVDVFAGPVVLCLCLHEKVWRLLGYEPALQDGGATTNLGEETMAYRFVDVGNAAFVLDNLANDAVAITPGPGYWTGWFTSARIDREGDIDGSGSVYDLDNNGFSRTYKPLHQGTVAVLSKDGDQDFIVNAQFPYVEGDPTVQLATTGATRGRYFAFRGKRIVGDVDVGAQLFDENGNPVDELETEDEAQIAQVDWDDNSVYGSVDTTANALPTFTIARWCRPRRFGVDRDKLDGEWSSLAGDNEFTIQCRPLNTWAYRERAEGVPDPQLERAHSVFGQILLSTGTANPDGWTSDEYEFGLNAPPTALNEYVWISDVQTSELGLGIPYQLVQDPPDIYAAFGEVAGDPHSPINCIRYAYSGPVQSYDVIDSIVRTRGLALTLRGGRYSLVPLGLFDPSDADAAITEDDLFGGWSPGGIRPTQKIRASGAIDGTELEFCYSPAEEATIRTKKLSAYDHGARYRRGDQIETLRDDGLRPDDWVKGQPWQSIFRDLWAFRRSEFLAKRHFTVRLKINRRVGQDLWPGSMVTLSHRDVVMPDGTRGCTNALAIVLSVTCNLPEHSHDVELLVYAGQSEGLRLFAPIARIDKPFAGGTTTVPIVQDHFGHGEGSDARRFMEPAWSNIGGNLRVGILYYDRTRWIFNDLGGTVEVTADSDTSVTLSANPGTFHAYTDKYLLALPWANQVDGEWPRELLLPVVLSDRSFDDGGGGATGYPFVSQ